MLNCHYTLPKRPEERVSHLIPGGSLKLRIYVVGRRWKLLIMYMASVIEELNRVEHWQNDTMGGRRKYSGTNTSQRPFFTTGLTWIGLGLNSVTRGDGPGTNPLIHGTSIVLYSLFPHGCVLFKGHASGEKEIFWVLKIKYTSWITAAQNAFGKYTGSYLKETKQCFLKECHLVYVIPRTTQNRYIGLSCMGKKHSFVEC
jgi:hypothetical protein